MVSLSSETSSSIANGQVMSRWQSTNLYTIIIIIFRIQPTVWPDLLQLFTMFARSWVVVVVIKLVNNKFILIGPLNKEIKPKKKTYKKKKNKNASAKYEISCFFSVLGFPQIHVYYYVWGKWEGRRGPVNIIVWNGYWLLWQVYIVIFIPTPSSPPPPS